MPVLGAAGRTDRDTKAKGAKVALRAHDQAGGAERHISAPSDAPFRQLTTVLSSMVLAAPVMAICRDFLLSGSSRFSSMWSKPF